MMALAALSALAALLGWLVGSSVLPSWGEGGATMVPWTAIGALALAASGAAGEWADLRGRAVSAAAAGLAGIVGLAALAEHATGWDAGGADQLWLGGRLRLMPFAHPGRPSIQTAVGLVVLAAAQLLLARRPPVAGVAALLHVGGACLGALGLLARLTGAALVETAGSTAPGLSLPTSVALAGIGTAGASAAYRAGLRAQVLQSPAATRVLRLLGPVAVVSPLATAVVRLTVARSPGTEVLGAVVTAASVAVLVAAVGWAARVLATMDATTRALADLLPVGVLAMRDGWVLYANPASRQVAHRPDVPLAGRPLADALGGAWAGTVRVAMESSVAAGGDQHVAAGVGPDGEPLDLAVAARDVTLLDGPARLCVLDDITARERTARELAESHRRLSAEVDAQATRFETLVETLPSGIVMVDGTGHVVLVNEATERMFGYPRAELLGRPVDWLLPEAARAIHAQHRAAYMADPSVRQMGKGRDLHGRRSDGGDLPVEVALTPLEVEGATHVVAVVADITERRRAAEALARYTQELERSNAELQQFAYVASHDLQEPLRMVVSYSELLAERYEGQLDERADKYIRYAVDGGRRMQGLIRDLLAYSRLGTRETRPEMVDTAAVLHEVLSSMARTIEAAEAVVEVNGDLPPVFADRLQLGQVLQNLVSNGLKFRDEHRSPRIRVAAERTGDTCRFTVSDNGIGIEPGHGDRIFQMFQRLHDRGRYEGSGIGLAIVRRIVERHGGSVGFESTPGAGSTFWFTLPATKVIDLDRPDEPAVAEADRPRQGADR